MSTFSFNTLTRVAFVVVALATCNAEAGPFGGQDSWQQMQAQAAASRAMDARDAARRLPALVQAPQQPVVAPGFSVRLFGHLARPTGFTGFGGH